MSESHQRSARGNPVIVVAIIVGICAVILATTALIMRPASPGLAWGAADCPPGRRDMLDSAGSDVPPGSPRSGGHRARPDLPTGVLREPPNQPSTPNDAQLPATPALAERHVNDPARNPSVHQRIQGRVHFCPELIVPKSCQCTLVVPKRSLSAGPFSITDTEGNLVLQVLPGRPGGGAGAREAAGGAAGPRSLTLATRAGDPLACCAAMGNFAAGPAEFQLLRPDGHCFAVLAHKGGYSLSVPDGARLHFRGAFESNGISVTDDEGKLLAATEPAVPAYHDPQGVAGGAGSNLRYRLSVAPLMDVGLVLSSILCIEHLST